MIEYSLNSDALNGEVTDSHRVQTSATGHPQHDESGDIGGYRTNLAEMDAYDPINESDEQSFEGRSSVRRDSICTLCDRCCSRCYRLSRYRTDRSVPQR